MENDVRVVCGDLTINPEKYLDTVEAEFTVEIFQGGVLTKSYVACITYHKWMKTLDFWDKELELPEVHIPFSKVEEFRNWLIANNFEG